MVKVDNLSVKCYNRHVTERGMNMNRKLKYSLLIIAGFLLIPFFRTAIAKSAVNQKEITLPLGKTIKGDLNSGFSSTYVFKPTEIGRLTITITSYVKDDITAYLYSDVNMEKKLSQSESYDEEAGSSTIKFDVYVNRRTYYLDLSSRFITSSGEFKIATKFTAVETLDGEKINDSEGSAIPLKNNKYYQGILTFDEEVNYYSIEFSKKKNLDLVVTCLDQAALDITILDSKGNKIHTDWCYSDTKLYSYSGKVPKGTYYIVVKKSGKEFQLGRRYEIVTGSYVPIKSLTVESKKTLSVGENYTLKPTLKPSDATGDCIFSSSDSSIVKVSKSGVITGLKKGTAVITVKSAYGKIKSTCKVTVQANVSVSKVTLNKSKATLYKGDKITLTATVAPKAAAKKTVTWKSSDAKIATVDSSGVITAKSVGKC